jgi:UDP-N-acetylmuramoyl-tripeptide--D-alanyl-D-alanine ligase
MMKLSAVCKLFNYSLPLTQDASIIGVSIDSRSLKRGEIFIAIVGEKYDGHDFLEQALENGACGAIVSAQHKVALLKEKKTASRFPLICVPDTQQALRDLAFYHRASLTFPVVALTGSCGKTTTKEMLAAILRERYRVFATRGNKNNHFGVPLSILQCSPEDEVGVFELGANHKGEIRSNVQLVKPDAALITNVGFAHIGEFGGVDAIFEAKSEIYEGLNAEGVAIYPYDDAFAEQWKKLLLDRPVLTFGINANADVFATNISYDAARCASFQLNTPKGITLVKLGLPGEHNILNALAACALSLTLEISLENMVQGLAKCSGVSGRLTFRAGLKGAKIIDDSYNANVKSIEAAIQVLVGFPGKRFLVLGDMGELGQWAEEHHRLIGIKASELGVDAVFTCGLLSQFTSDAFREQGNELGFHFPDIPTLVDVLEKYLDDQTTVVVKGSLSAHMKDVVSKIVLEA